MTNDEKPNKDEREADGSREGAAEETSHDAPESAGAADRPALPEDDAPAQPATAEAHEEDDAGAAATPTQFGYKRFVYGAYLAGGIIVAFLSTKIVDLAWTRLGQWKPEFGEPRDEIVAPLAALVGAGVAYKYWRDEKIRKLAEEVAEELTKVTWPGRKEVTTSTAVVIFATAFATTFFFLMDKFWSFVTNLVYGS